MRRIQQAPRRAVDQSLNAEVPDLSREMGMNISQTVDALLTETALKQYRQRWNSGNKEAIDHDNARVERHGLFPDRYRSFMRPASEQDQNAA